MSADHEMTQALPRILIVDDSRIVRATLGKHLKEFFDLVERGDGEAGWEALVADDSIRVVISDLSMPLLDGIGLLQRIRASEDPRIQHTPVVIISGEEDEAVKLNASANGANDFVTKSTDKVELVTRVTAMVQMAKTVRDLMKAREVTETQATTDPLTGLGTPHLFQLQGRQMFSFAQRHQGQVGAVMLQFDQLAEQASRLPQTVADQALALLCKLVASKCRKEDIVAYLGNYRIAVLTSAVDYAEAVQLANRLYKAVLSAKIKYKDDYIKTTASVGGANTALDFCASLDDLVRIATERMERALAEGGNRVFVADEAQAVLPTPVPVIQRALQMLAEGQEASLDPHLADLMRKLLPLIEYADRKLELGMPVEALKSRLISPN